MIDSIYTLLKAIGLNEPLHPPITHMPIGLTVGAFLFILLAVLFKRKALIPTARHTAILAFVFVFPTILLGVFDWMHFYHAILMPAIVTKMVLASIVLVVLGAVVILGGETKFHGWWLSGLLALAFVGVMGLGYVGSGIVYGRGTTPVPATIGKSESVSPAPTSSAAAMPEDFKRGQAVFTDNCSPCHGNGLNAIVPNLPLKTSAKLASLSSFEAFVRKPSMPDGSAGQMPNFGEDQLGKAELRDLYAYVTKAWK